MTDDIEIIHSPLERTYSAEGHTLRIQIYRSSDSPWTLEIEDEQGTSTVWDDPFDSDQAALDAALSDIEADGIHSFLTKATTAAQAPIGGNDLFEPLSDEELDELDQFLLYELDTEDGMTLDMLDGYLHAIVIGPKFIHPHQWLPKVWGTDDGTPPGLDTFNRMLQLVMRHYNSIVSGFAAHPPVLSPVWGTRITDDGEFDDVEMWAYGFTEGVKLDQTAWQALLDGPDGNRWYRPIALLGEDEFSADQDALTQTPEQRQALAADIESSLLHIHAYWLPVRQAIHERQQSQRMGAKVGRNEPCPCGSGKKFKKCCGSPSELQ